MEATGIQHNAGKNQLNKWASVPSSDTCKNGICASCLSKHNQTQQLILPLSKLREDDFDMGLGKFLKSISEFQYPVLFHHPNEPIKVHALIKFTGHESFQDSFKVIKPFLPQANIPATIISPFALSKNNRLKEQDLVQLTKQYFEPLGFIKLHLHSVADFHEYGNTENVGLLMMPLKDLPDYVHYAMQAKNAKRVIPAIFQP